MWEGSWSDGITALLREDTQVLELALSPHAQPGGAQQWEDSLIQARKKAVTRNQLCWHPDLELPVSRIES